MLHLLSRVECSLVFIVRMQRVCAVVRDAMCAHVFICLLLAFIHTEYQATTKLLRTKNEEVRIQEGLSLPLLSFTCLIRSVKSYS